MANEAETADHHDIELNRWAIAMAIDWPVNHFGDHSKGVMIGTDADVIGRAEKIIAWVKMKH